MRHGQQRYVLRVSGFLSMAEVRAEHRILLAAARAAFPFRCPSPWPRPAGGQ